LTAITIIDGQGRLTIPNAIREQLGIKPGDAFILEADSDTGTMRLIRLDNPFDSLAAYAIHQYHAGQTRNLRDYTAESEVDLCDSDERRR
jgi:AbrB family looped-hinge helix DNA binding protein